MADVFAYNGDSFLPDYLPGLIGYGQRGANGNIGATGASVHYSSLNVLVYEDSSTESSSDTSVLSTESDHINKEVIDLILKGKELSNNGYSSRSVDYMVNDVILDRTGRFYIIKEINKDKEIVVIKSIDDFGKSNYSIITNTFTGLSVYCSTTFLKSDSKKWIQPNPSYDGIDYFNGTHSPKVYHCDDLGENIFGNFVNFSLSYDTAMDISKYTYKFVLAFPNGQTVESYSEVPYKTIFIDNKLVYGWFDTNGWASSFNFSLANLKKEYSLLGSDNDEDSKELSNLVESYIRLGDSLKCRGAVYDASANNNVSGKENTVLCSFFIKYNCSAYAEIVDTESGVVYRIDMDDIFISKSGSQITNKRPVIEECVQSSVWEIKNYNNYENGSFLKNENGTLFNPMHSYVFIAEEENIYDANDVRVLSEDGIIENVYFTDASGLAYYTGIYEILGYNGSGDGKFSGSNEIYQNANGIYEDLKDIVKKIEISGNEPLTSYDQSVQLQPFNYDDTSANVRDTFISSAIRYKYDVVPYNIQFSQENADQFPSNNPYKDCNRTLKLSFKNAESITINVVFEELFGLKHPDTNNPIQYPLAMVYIGYIDHPLIVLPNSNEENETPGIYYLTKFVPPGYSGNEKDVQYTSAGMADLTINVPDFGLNPRDEHYIEIGVTLLDVRDDSGKMRTREQINSMHVNTVIPDSSTRSTFFSNINASIPELKIYVSKISSVDDSYVEEVKPEDSSIEEDINIFNNYKIDTPTKNETT